MVDPTSSVLLSHWLPPPTEVEKHGRGYSTFFFAGQHMAETAVQVDGGEISEHVWLRPADALQRHAAGALSMLPPTWMTILTLEQCAAATAAETLRRLGECEPLAYETRSSRLPGGRTIYLFEGDAGWPSSDASVAGRRRRLVASRRSPPWHAEEDPPITESDTLVFRLECSTSDK